MLKRPLPTETSRSRLPGGEVPDPARRRLVALVPKPAGGDVPEAAPPETPDQPANRRLLRRRRGRRLPPVRHRMVLWIELPPPLDPVLGGDGCLDGGRLALGPFLVLVPLVPLADAVELQVERVQGRDVGLALVAPGSTASELEPSDSGAPATLDLRGSVAAGRADGKAQCHIQAQEGNSTGRLDYLAKL